MNIGMLWLDDAKNRTVEEKVARAAAYYVQKYGQSPNFCLINEASLLETVTIGDVKVQPAKNILPQHLWIGIHQN